MTDPTPTPADDIDRSLVDLASARLGARVLAVSDEFFAAASNLLQPGEAVWDAERYTEQGKWMDGWESRRRRTPGHDWCVIKLGVPGVIEHVLVDTAHFTGNHPAEISLDVCEEHGLLADDPALASLDGLWQPVLPVSPVAGGSPNPFPLARPVAATHVRLNIHPDGGVARLRVRGRVSVDPWRDLRQPSQLARLDGGARILACSDEYFSAPGNLLLPSRSTGMHDGWETRRRRGPGHDWVVLELGSPGRIERAEIDTSFFRGNAPGSVILEVCDEGVDAARPDDAPWRPLLGDTPLNADELHVFEGELGEHRHARYVRMAIFPDGGVARLRLLGTPDAVADLAAGVARLDALDRDAARTALLDCCHSEAWVDAVLAARPFGDARKLLDVAARSWRALDAEAWQQAFAAHPAIGDAPSGSDTAARWAAGEQAASADASADVRQRLAAGNRAYRERHGFVFLVCATGRAPEHMLAQLEHRLGHDTSREIEIAADEQRRITALRLLKLLGDP